MTQSIQDLERDIEESRARLDLTIDRIQDRMSMSGIVDDMMGTARRSGYSGMMDRAVVAVRENPVPVLLVVAGLGWLLHRMSTERTVRPVSRTYLYDRSEVADAEPRTVIVTDTDHDDSLGASPRPAADPLGAGAGLTPLGAGLHART